MGFEMVHVIEKPSSVFLGVWVDRSEDMPLDDQSEETHKYVGPDSLFRVVEHRLDGDQTFEIPKSPLNLLERLVVSSGFGGGNVFDVGNQNPLAVKELLSFQFFFIQRRVDPVGKPNVFLVAVFHNPLFGGGGSDFFLNDSLEKGSFSFGCFFNQRIEENKKSPVLHMTLNGWDIHGGERVFPLTFQDPVEKPFLD